MAGSAAVRAEINVSPTAVLAATRAAHEKKGSSWANLTDGVPGDLQRQQDMGIQVATCLIDVELCQGRVAGAGAGDQHVVDRRGQLVEELPEPIEVGRRTRHAGPDLASDAVQAFRVARR